MRNILRIFAVSNLVICACFSALAGPQSIPAPDAPELSKLGEYAVGTDSLEFIQQDQTLLVLGKDAPVVGSRNLRVRLWYPAETSDSGIIYHTALPGADNLDVPFDVEGVASGGAQPASGSFPLIILAHGFSNTPEVLSWLGENIASKGYFVVAPAFDDPPINIRTAESTAIPLSRRPLDIAFVAREVRDRQAAKGSIFESADVSRTALIGYSMGGYGVLTSAGAPLDPIVINKTKGVLSPYVSGAARAAELVVPDLKAVVAIAPPGGIEGRSNWVSQGVAAITVPTMYIVGEQDHAVGYNPGVRSLFEGQSYASRYLLSFLGAGHSIALIGAPESMRESFYNIEWFEDAVWRKDRLLAIQNHFITAFLDSQVKGDADSLSYIDGLTVESNDGVWPNPPIGRFAGYSPGGDEITVWKGFQKGKATGMTFEHLLPSPERAPSDPEEFKSEK